MRLFDDWPRSFRALQRFARAVRAGQIDPAQSVAQARARLLAPLRYPRKLFCVGANYADHLAEMNASIAKVPGRPPFFFMKPANAIVPNGTAIPYPQVTKDLHHEIEMVVALGKGGANVPVDRALDLVWGYGVGLDMTRRDIQGEAKKMGRPWEMGKAFDNSAPCTALHPASRVGHPAKGAIWLKVNGVVKQKGDLSEMIWNVPETIAYLSKMITLRAGDVIMSGTPAGVGPVQKGDQLEEIGRAHV